MILYIQQIKPNAAQKIETLNVIDNAFSVIWCRRYGTPGEFEIAVPPSEALWRNLSANLGYLIVTREDTDIPMYVERIRMTEGAEGDTIIISGRSMDAVLDSRVIGYRTAFPTVVPPVTVISVSYEQAIRQLVLDNLINPDARDGYPEDATTRRMRPFAFEVTQLGGGDLERTFWGENLLEAVDELLSEKEWGLKCRLVSDVFTFYLYSGQDRPMVVFSANNENLLSCEYDIDIRNKRNVVFVTAEGSEDTLRSDGTNPYTMSAQGGNKGAVSYNRRESSMSATYTEYDETVEQNIYNESWERGGYTWEGTPAADTSRIRCTSFWACGKKFSVTAKAGSEYLVAYLCFYVTTDENRGIGQYGPFTNGQTVTAPSNANYMRISLARSGGSDLEPANLTSAKILRVQKKEETTYRTDLEALGTPYTTKARQILQAEIKDGGLFRPDVDYFLGDTVHIVTAHGIKGAARVQEITEVEDAEGYRIYPTFSEWTIDS